MRECTNMNTLGFSFSEIFGLGDDKKKIDPNTLSVSQLKDKASKGLSFYYAAAKREGLKGSYSDFIKYIDKLHPTYRMHLGKMLYNAENSLGTPIVNTILGNLGSESGGKLPTDPADLQVFGDVLVGELTAPSITTMSKWVVDSVVKSGYDIAAIVDKYKMPLIVGGVGVVGLGLFVLMKMKR